MEDLTSIVAVIGFASFAVHILLWDLLGSRLDHKISAFIALTGDPPNLPGAPRAKTFLRLRYLLPWTSLPSSVRCLDTPTKKLLLATRIAGFTSLSAFASLAIVIFSERLMETRVV